VQLVQYGTEQQQVQQALLELTHAAAQDIPPEALLARHSVLDNTLQLLGSSSSGTAVQEACAGFLQQMMARCKQALVLAADPAYACRPSPTDAELAAEVAAGLLGMPPHSSYPVPAQQRAQADIVLQALRGEADDWVDVSAAALKVARCCCELLRQPERHGLLLPLLQELLPLLLTAPGQQGSEAPSSGAGGSTSMGWLAHEAEQQQEKAQEALSAAWARELLQPLAVALSSTLAMAACSACRGAAGLRQPWRCGAAAAGPPAGGLVLDVASANVMVLSVR
jgi:hypothetical protein